MRTAQIALLPLPLLMLLPLAAAAPPTGRRAPRPRPTHVLLAEATFGAGGVRVKARPGVAVSAPAVRGVPRGKVKVTTVGDVEVTGTVDGAALGQRIARDVELRSPDGAAVIGAAAAGTLVRPARGRAPAGMVLIDLVGPVAARAAVPADALAATGSEPVVADEFNVRASAEVDLFPTLELAGPPIARVAGGAELLGLEESDRVTHVRTLGGARLEGWVARDRLVARRPDEPAPRPAAAPPIRPTHEVFVDTPLYGGAAGGRPAGVLRGGTLVQASGDGKAERTQVVTRGDASAAGWVRTADLRALEAAIWAEPPVGR